MQMPSAKSKSIRVKGYHLTLCILISAKTFRCNTQLMKILTV